MSAARPHADDAIPADAFVLYGGMGPCAYLTTDGRVLEDHRGWDDSEPPVREASDDEAIAWIVAGARRTGVRALLELLPRAPVGATACARCAGSRWITLPVGQFVCPRCHGRGLEP